MKGTSSLTEEQKLRIQNNRERALEIQRRKRKEREEKESLGKLEEGESVVKRKKEEGESVVKREKEEVILEDFEVNASTLVSKKEAKLMYCLPEGTLAVCSFVEKENPRCKGWTKMKLFDRSEIRSRARKRFGGVEGLVEERERRTMSRFKKDLDDTKDIFN